ncbi:MAG: flagellar basal body rod C-terminal domain-containing protein, partial [Pseudobdellovibrionaceae bacterium]
NAAGDFAANSLGLNRYADNIISAAALKADIAADQAANDKATMDSTSDFVKNESGVNVDEETAKLLELENAYQAAASVLAAIRDLFDDLLLAVR